MIVAALVMLVTVLVMWRFFMGSKSIPGPKAKSKSEGNLPDIAAAGSLHEYLLACHAQYGDIFRIMMGSEYVVVICSHEYFKEFQAAYNRPPSLFMLFAPFIGSMSIQYANFEDIRYRRKEYDRSMSHKAIVRYLDEFVSVSNIIISSLEEKKNEKSINFSELCADYAIRVDVLSLFGQFRSDKQIRDFHRNYLACWDEMEARMTSLPSSGSERERTFQKSLEFCKEFVRNVIKERHEMEITDENERFIDILINAQTDEDVILADAITYIVGAFHTTANSLVWAFYHLANNPVIQERAFQEIKNVIADKEEIDFESLSKLTYLRQVFDETLRCAVIAPWGARFDTEDKFLDGYKIPRNTPVLTALGVTFKRPDYWENPDKFDPDRFSEDAARNRPTLAFQPFGFAGRRTCPGYRFAINEALVCLLIVIRKFKLELVPGQDIRHVYGLVTHPSHDVMVTVTPRS